MFRFLAFITALALALSSAAAANGGHAHWGPVAAWVVGGVVAVASALFIGSRMSGS